MEGEQKQEEAALKIPEPVVYGGIKFFDGEILVEYTDCWEISVLRLLHFLFGRAGAISHQKLTALMNLENKHCQALIAYFTESPKYHIKSDFYSTEEGWALRANWCQFLNRTGLFYLKKEGKYEVAATFPNTLAFFQGFFPKLEVDFDKAPKMTLENVLSEEYFNSCVQILNKIYSQLSEDELRAQMEVSLFPGGASLYFSANQKLYVEGKHLLDWEISEVYEVKEEEEIGARQGGHSDYRYARK